MSDSKLTPPTGDAAMSVRECRLIIERLLVAAGTLPGEVPAVRDIALAAQIHGFEIMQYLHEHELRSPSTTVDVELADDCLVVSAHDAFSLFTLPLVRDLILEHPHVSTVILRGVELPKLASVLNALPELEAFSLDVQTNDGTARLAVRAVNEVKDHSAIVRAHRRGLPVPGAVWLDLYLRSNDALLTESAQTRHHAGHQDVDLHGRIVRPMDDDVDIEHALSVSKTTKLSSA